MFVCFDGQMEKNVEMEGDGCDLVANKNGAVMQLNGTMVKRIKGHFLVLLHDFFSIDFRLCVSFAPLPLLDAWHNSQLRTRVLSRNI